MVQHPKFLYWIFSNYIPRWTNVGWYYGFALKSGPVAAVSRFLVIFWRFLPKFQEAVSGSFFRPTNMKFGLQASFDLNLIRVVAKKNFQKFLLNNLISLTESDSYKNGGLPPRYWKVPMWFLGLPYIGNNISKNLILLFCLKEIKSIFVFFTPHLYYFPYLSYIECENGHWSWPNKQ